METVDPMIELAWAAGFFEGEGHTGGAAKRPPYCEVAQAGLEPLERFNKAVWGLCRVYGPRSKANRKDMWYVRTPSFEAAQQVLILLWANLSTRRKAQAAAAFSRYLTPFWNGSTVTRGSEVTGAAYIQRYG